MNATQKSFPNVAILTALLLLTLPAVAQAEDYTYTTVNSMITITGYTGTNSVITIPDTIGGLPVNQVGNSAFLNERNLTSITIPNSVTNIGFSAFEGCASLASLTIPNRVGVIQSSAFEGCASLTSITIPNSVTVIFDWAFFYCVSLTNITIGTNVTSIRDSAFSGCTSLTSITIPNSVVSFGPFTPFLRCTNLTGITVEALNPAYISVDGVLFNKTQTYLIKFPEGKAGSYVIPSTVTRIGNWAFNYCASLTSLTIPNGITSIIDSAFYDCASLTSITIPNSVTNIGGGAFYNCASLTDITIPNSVTTIGSYPFARCGSLTGITVDALNPAYCSVDGVLFNKSQTYLIQFPGGKAGNYLIPTTVTSIGDQAFFYCTNLTSLTIPESVTNIERAALNNCTTLVGAYFKGNAPSLGVLMFYGTQNVTVYYLPGTIGWGATFGDRPTAFWQPQMQTGDGGFGVQTNQFGFNIAWASGQVVVVEAATNLGNPT